MDFLRDVVTEQGCDVDGSNSSRVNNPVNAVFNNIMTAQQNTQFAQEIDTDNLLNTTTTTTTFPMQGTQKTPQSSIANPRDQMKVRNRSEVLARHLYGDQGDQAVEQTLSSMLQTFNIAPNNMGSMNSTNTSLSMYNFNAMDKSKTKKFFVEDDVDLDQTEEGDLDQFMNEFNSVDVQQAYEKYLDYMKQTLSLDHIQKSKDAYIPLVNDNPYLNTANTYETGVQLWNQGDLMKAIAAFEAAVAQDGTNADAWRMLGLCHAECDDDAMAINALAHAVDANPQHLGALLDLGVCYTNELNKMRALVYLKSWIQHHPKYAHLIEEVEKEKQAMPKDKDDLGHLYNYFQFHQEVITLFKKATSIAPQDADLYAVLGVLFNISHDYDQAINSFTTALKFRPNDYSLWNKLGATQANSSKSAKAVEAYKNALKLKPNYIRAWINLGISYANLKNYQESVKYYLRALTMCPRAENVWQYLAMAFTCMERPDLVDLCKFKDVSKFKDFVQF